ncbi:MAG TPA: hypothetical protein VFT43_16265, partial [Candidatus Polarisedimenticolia bacterium]|nr:hypothetical protein [Candidatus Polarisedimenticolia bacterium]
MASIATLVTTVAPWIAALGWLAAGVLWALTLAAVGSRARAASRLPLPPGLRLPIDFLLGAWIAGAAMLACGLAGAFRPAVLILVVAALAAAGRWSRQGWRWRSLLPGIVPACLLLPVALAPPFFYDALVYHLALPWQALREGRIAPHPEDLFAAFPPLAQLINAAPLATGLDRVPALLHLASFVAAAAALVCVARRLGAPAVLAALAGATLLLLPALALVPGLPASEGWAIAPVIAAIAIVLDRRQSIGRAVLAGFLLGAASAARLQGIAWSVIVIALLAGRSIQSRRGPAWAAVARRCGAFVAAWAIGSAPWWLKNLILLRDPLAPLGWRREGIDTLWLDAGATLHLAGGHLGAWPRALIDGLGPHLAYLLPLALAAALALVSARERTGDPARAGTPAPGSEEGRHLWPLAGAVVLGLCA